MPAAVEEGLGAMTRGEHAVISCARADALAGAHARALLPSPPGTTERAEFELQLLSMVQVGEAAVFVRVAVVCSTSEQKRRSKRPQGQSISVKTDYSSTSH